MDTENKVFSEIEKTSRRLIVGLTGAIGSGKTLAAKIFSELGCDIIDADRCGHEALRDRGVVARLSEYFGDQILDSCGQIVRPALAAVAFKDDESVAALNSIVHPEISRQMRQKITQLCSDGPVAQPIIIDAALLFESEWSTLCDIVVLVDCPYDIRLKRVQENRGWDENELARREKFHILLDTKRQKAHNILVNSSNESNLREQVCLLHHHLSRRNA